MRRFILFMIAASAVPLCRGDEGPAEIERQIAEATESLQRHFGQGDIESALQDTDRLIELQTRRSGAHGVPVAVARFYRGALLDRVERREDAREEYEHALRIIEQDNSGSTSAQGLRVQIINNLASNRRATNHLARAEALYAEAVSLARDSVLRAEDAEHRASLARALNNLAELRRTLNRNLMALADAEEALTVAERLEESSLRSRLVGLCAHTLGRVRDDLGQTSLALRLYALALENKIVAHGQESLEVAFARNTLGITYFEAGQLDQAMEHLMLAWPVLERRAPQSDDFAAACNNLGLLRMCQGQMEEAERLLDRSRAIRAAGGPEKLARTLDSLGDLFDRKGQPERALEFAEEALTLREGATAEEWRVVQSLDRLAQLSERIGRHEAARNYWSRALDEAERRVEISFAGLGSRQRLSLAQSARGTLNRWLALHSEDAGAYPRILQLKAVVARRMRLERASLAASGEEVQALVRSLALLEATRSALILQRPAADLDGWRSSLAQVQGEHETLEREVSKRLTGVPRKDPADLAAIQAALAEDSLLIDYVRHDAGYSAWLVRRHGPPKRFDLGPAEAINRASKDFVQAAQQAPSPEADALQAAGAVLADLIWKPFAGLASGAATLCVVPDGALASVPFAALPGGESGAYLGERATVTMLAAAQDLVPLHPARTEGMGLLLIGDVDYGPPGAFQFGSLPGSRHEIDTIAALAESSGVSALVRLTSTFATEEAVRREVIGRRILHFSSHGFLQPRGAPEKGSPLPPSLEQYLVHLDPMALAGVALSGANGRATVGDGILTAAEASRLDLDAAELVVLSACDTGLGQFEAGEGVLGLVRGFQAAGARTVVATLWKVDDGASAFWMGRFYERILSGGLSPSQACAEVARDWRAGTHVPPSNTLRGVDVNPDLLKAGAGKSTPTAPRYWAAFVAYEIR